MYNVFSFVNIQLLFFYLFFQLVPGEISQPNVFYENSTRITVLWKKPAKPAGPVDYYQLVYAHHSGPTNSQITDGDPTTPLALASTHIQENSNSRLYQSDCNYFNSINLFISYTLKCYIFSTSTRFSRTCSRL